jgi:hypothetical protein
MFEICGLKYYNVQLLIYFISSTIVTLHHDYVGLIIFWKPTIM